MMRDRGQKYILNNQHVPIAVPDDDEWWEWYNIEKNRRVGEDHIGDIVISTVFTAWDITPDRCLFETMVFGGRYDRECWRTHTWEEAEAKHKEIVAVIEAEHKS